MDIRVLLADDHRLVRDGLRALLADEPGIAVVAEADDGRSAVRLAADLSPDVVVMDVGMPDLNGIEATRQIRAAAAKGGSGPRVVALSAHSDPRFVAETLAAGAAGFVFKASAFEELAVAVRTAAAGRVYLGPAVAAAVVDGVARGGGPSAFTTLTPREREVLQLTAEGRAMKEIAPALGVSIKTVESHRKNIMDKLGVDNVAGLTKYAIREGLTSTDA